MAALYLLVQLFSSAPSAALDWSAARPGSGELILRAPGLPDTPSSLNRATEDWNIYEVGGWEAPGADWPQAMLFLIRMKDIAPSTKHFVKTVPVAEMVRGWLPGESLQMGQSGRAENELGELDIQRFRRAGNVDCVGVEQGISTFSDAIDFTSGAALLGDKIIRGWYCVPSGTRNVDQVLDAFVRGIGLQGFADPSRSGQVSIDTGE